MTALLDSPPEFFVVAMAIITILLAVVGLARAALGPARDWRRFRDGQ